MTNYFHSQLTSIMESLTRAAVAEICELVGDGYAVLQLEVTRSHQENDALRRKLRLIESIVDRGQQHRRALGGGEAAALEAGGAGRYPRERTSSAQRPPGGTKGGRQAAIEAAAERSLAVSAFLLEEEGGAEADVEEQQEELLLNEDGTEAPPLELSDSEEGPSSGPASLRPWDHTLNDPGDLQPPLSVSPSPVFQVENGSSRDYLSQPDATSPGKPLRLPGPPGGGPDALPVTFDLKRGVSMLSSLPYDTELEMCSAWNNPGPPSSGAPGPYPDRRLPDEASGLGAFPSSLGPGRGSEADSGPEPSRSFSHNRRFVCTYCCKCFTSSRSLETHLRVHTGERPYSCAQCGKRFTQSGHLKTHQSVHTGDRPFACQHCGKRFAGKQNLRIHQHKYHPVP
ncbi:hypothetical protein NHX12_004801 [Muraenolepis orangiensis]|uniref:C2H2-type domain-containing protein n=1 Tax=Muraenolepis orangiensis TaxID=630683 RepID=A0A9Q0IEY5_9TELE|nr:hypothetical protein NHX12_004801 [Muraenolepis orangiensis]